MNNITCANGDIRGLTPPSRSICAIVQAILSSLQRNQSQLETTCMENSHFVRRIQN